MSLRPQIERRWRENHMPNGMEKFSPHIKKFMVTDAVNE